MKKQVGTCESGFSVQHGKLKLSLTLLLTKVNLYMLVSRTFITLLLLRCSTTFSTASMTCRAAVFLQAAFDAFVPNACLQTRKKIEGVCTH